MEPTPPNVPSRTRRARALVGLASLALAPLLGGCGEPRGTESDAHAAELGEAPARVAALPAGPRTATAVVRRVLFDGDWEVLAARSDRSPTVRRIRPVEKALVPGDVRDALSMPPPCTLQFTLAPETLNEPVAQNVGPLRLHAAVGVHYDAVEPDTPGRIRFRIEVDGERVFQTELPLARPAAGNAWVPVGGAGGAGAYGDAGLEVPPGAVVRLHTELLGVAPEAAGIVPAGFATLELRREYTKPVGRATPETPNLVLIVMDTLRSDRLECYGYDRPTSPRLNALAARGTLFEQAYGTAPWTWPSTASLLTGRWPETHGVTSAASCFLASGLETLPEALSGRGYWTAAFTCNPLIVRDQNFDQGFDEFEDGNIPGVFERGFANTDKVQADVLGWIDANRDARFFLYLHLVDTHWPYSLVPEAEALLDPLTEPADFPKRGLAHYQNRLIEEGGPTACKQATLDEYVPPEHRAWLAALYDAAVRSADTHVGTILDRLHELGLDDRTVVVFTSDHGEELFDHGMPAHGYALYEEHVRVPLIVAGPGIARGRREPTPVSNRHVATLLARLGGTTLDDVRRPLDLLEPIEPRPVFFSTESGLWCGQTHLSMFGVRDGEQVWIRALDARPWGAEGTEPSAQEGRLLFDLTNDPDQRTNLVQVRPGIAGRMEATLSEHVATAVEARAFDSIPADSATLRMLREIGYVSDESEAPASDGTTLAPRGRD